MEDIKLWQLEGYRATPLAPNNRLESEHLLEETLVENPSLLLDGLTLVGRQTPTEGGPLDLLGVDEDGKLTVFELKRGTLNRDAVAQILDYASGLDDMGLEDLVARVEKGSGRHGIDEIEDFREWYEGRFEHLLREPEHELELELLKPLRLFLVGLGVDATTERMVRFLARNSAMDISLLTFHGFDQGGKTLLAKQVEVKPEDVSRARRSRRKSKAERYALFNAKVDLSEVAGLFNEVKAMFREIWPKSREWPRLDYGLNLRLRKPTGSPRRPVPYARLDPLRDEVVVVFYPRAVRLCREAFRPLVEGVEAIPFQTWKPNREPLPPEGEQPEIQFKLTPEVWAAHKDRLVNLVQSIEAARVEAWHAADERSDDGQ